MEETQVLLVFPGSLYGGAWAAGPRVKPELVGLSSELRRAGFPVDVLELEAELGNPGDDAAREALPELSVFLSRGCPYNAPACLLRPGGVGWHAYPPDVALGLLDDLAALSPKRVDVLDPAFGFDAVWWRTILDRIAAADRRDIAVTVAGKPVDVTREDVNKLYRARLRLCLDVGTLSRDLLARSGQAPKPSQAVEHALDRLTYLDARGLVTVASFTFNQPGETRATAAETLDVLERFVDEAPNGRSRCGRSRGRSCPPARPSRTSTRRRSASARRLPTPSGGRVRTTRARRPPRSSRAKSWRTCRPVTRATGGRASTSCARGSTPSLPARLGAGCAATRPWARRPTACRTGGV